MRDDEGPPPVPTAHCYWLQALRVYSVELVLVCSVLLQQNTWGWVLYKEQGFIWLEGPNSVALATGCDTTRQRCGNGNGQVQRGQARGVTSLHYHLLSREGAQPCESHIDPF